LYASIPHSLSLQVNGKLFREKHTAIRKQVMEVIAVGGRIGGGGRHKNDENRGGAPVDLFVLLLEAVERIDRKMYGPI
jgi:hypothetical protein